MGKAWIRHFKGWFLPSWRVRRKLTSARHHRASKPCLVNQCLAETLRWSQGHPWRQDHRDSPRWWTNTTSKTTGKSPCWSLSHEKKYHSFSHLMKYSWSLLVYSLQLSPINGFYSPRTQVVQLPNQSTTRPASVGQESAHPLLDVAGHVQVLSAGGLHPSIYPRYP